MTVPSPPIGDVPVVGAAVEGDTLVVFTVVVGVDTANHARSERMIHAQSNHAGFERVQPKSRRANNICQGSSYFLCGQLNILKLEPNFSPSSSVLGKWVHKVSGRKRAENPPITDKKPMMTSGKTWL